MAYKSLQHFVETLENSGELVRIKRYVNPELAITEITDRVSKSNGPALLFENTGTDFPLLINSMGSYRRMCMAMGCNEMDDIALEIQGLFKEMTAKKESLWDKLMMLPKLGQIASYLPKTVNTKAPCQEVIMRNPNLDLLPIMKCWPQDGGRYITLPIIHTFDPETGNRNVGMYRMQVIDSQTLAVHWQLHKVSRKHFEVFKKLGKRMPVAVALGGDPVYTYAATAPLPENIDEYILAGFIRKKRVDLVKCITQDIEVPADADIIIEGYVDPLEEFFYEGPFGDHTGYYSLPDYYPKMHVTAITHRRGAIYPSTIVGIPPQEDAWIGKATERIFLAPIKMTMVPEIIDMDLPIEGVFHNMALIQIEKTYPGQGLKVMNSLWGAGQMMFTKMMIVVDQHTTLKDYTALAKYISVNFNPLQDLVVGQGPIDVLDHSCSKMAFGGKLGIDATKKLDEEIPVDFVPPKILPTTATEILAACKQYPEITYVNTALLTQSISVVILSVRKTRVGQIKALHKSLSEHPAFAPILIMLYLDEGIDIDHLGDAFWRFCNNTDVKRDLIVTEPVRPGEVAHIGLDGTRKTKELDGFQRDWPNILVMKQEIIKEVDEYWGQLGLGSFISSPSNRYRKGLYGLEAVAAG